jgi:predicted  nucleic acid-binding Zn-ribbon protein
MKKIILIVFLGIMLTTGTAYALNTPLGTGANLVQREAGLASRAAVITQTQANISQDLKQRAEKEITRRINFLNELIAQLNGIKKISSAEKADLQTQIQAQIDGLNTLQTKINSDTDNVTLKADVKSIISNYYIFLFFRVKINLLAATDRASTISDNMSQIYSKLQTRINQAQAAGDDVTNSNLLLADINAKITDANTQITAIQTELTSLTAQGYPGNKPTLEDARTKLKTVSTDLKTAYKDALQIRNDLKGLKIKNPEASSSAH